MAQPRTDLAKERAEMALANITGRDASHLMHLGQYRTRKTGGSIEASLGSTFVSHHGLDTQEEVVEFFDTDTGALVIVPSESLDGPAFGGD